MICRYKFPKDLVEETTITVDQNDPKINLKRNDNRMNNHMPFISVHWRANVDVTPIVSTNAVIRYIAKYASKSEPSSNCLNELREHLNSIRTENRTSLSLVQCILLKQCAMRDYSAQECIWILLGFFFWSSSRKFLIINFSSDRYVPIEDDDQTQNDPEYVYAHRLNNFQAARRRGHQPNLNESLQPQEDIDDARNLSMFNFYSKYYKQTRNAVCWSRHTKAPIIRIFPRLNSTNQHGDLNQDFFKQQIKLHVPWLNDFHSQLNPNDDLWTDIYSQYSNLIPNFLDLNAGNLSDSENEYEDEESNRNRDQDLHEWQIYARLRPNSNEEAAELGLREQDNINWSASFDNYENHNELRDFITQQQQINNLVIEDVSMPDVQFSDEQLKVLRAVESQIHFIQTGEQLCNFTRSIIIQGVAGSGKSTLIQAMKSIINRQLGQNQVIIVAPTGSAASNINCSTIHSKFKISTHRTINVLSTNALSELQNEFRQSNFLIIDEISLLDCSLFKKIDIRCRESKSINDRSFGGLFLILMGDLKQLPPVLDRPFYGSGYNSEYVNDGQSLFRSIESSIILSTSHRLRPDQIQFREILNRLSDGEITLRDYEILGQREIDLLNPNDFANSIRLFDTCAKANQYNEERLRNLTSVLRVKSINNCKIASRASFKEAGNLQQFLYLAIGSRVMLRRNLWTSVGLVNGAIRTIRDIVVEPNTGNSMPRFIIVEFDRYNGLTINGIHGVPIAPQETRWFSGNEECHRVQLPLTEASATTIHKSQGMTLDSAVVDIGEKEISSQLGLAYVAFSRVRTLNSLALIKIYDFETRFKSIRRSNLLRLRKIEEERLRLISL